MSATINIWANTSTFNIKSTNSNNHISTTISLDELNSLKHILDTKEESKLEGYFSRNLILTSTKNQKLSLDSISINQAENKHEVTIELFYQSGTISSISNTLLFGINTDQQNTHVYNNIEFTTSSNHPLHSFKMSRNIPTSFSIGTIILVLIFMGLIVFKKRNPIVFDRVSY